MLGSYTGFFFAKYTGHDHVLERVLISPLTLKNSVTDPVRLTLGD